MKLSIELTLEDNNRIGISGNITGTTIEALGMIELVMFVLDKKKATYLNILKKESTK